jgi:hypothetical protein
MTLASIVAMECERRGLPADAERRVLAAVLGALRREQVALEARERLRRGQLRIC